MGLGVGRFRGLGLEWVWGWKVLGLGLEWVWGWKV